MSEAIAFAVFLIESYLQRGFVCMAIHQGPDLERSQIQSANNCAFSRCGDRLRMCAHMTTGTNMESTSTELILIP